MTDLEALQSYRYALTEVQTVAEQLEELRSLPHCGRTAQVSACEHQLAECQERLDGVIRQFDELIARIRNPRTRMIIRQYYALGQSDERVALASGMSTRTVNKIRNRYLHDLAVLEEDRQRKSGQKGQDFLEMQP